jgi:hypothetical protein
VETRQGDDHPHVAHYQWPPATADAQRTRRDAEVLARAERESARQRDFARWRVPRYAVAVALVCLSIAGGATAVIATIVAIADSGQETVDLVVGVDAEGAVTRSITLGQLYLFVGAIIALEVLLVCAAALLFAQALHSAAWTVVTVSAAIASGLLLWGVTSGMWWSTSAEYPYVAAFPVIVVAGLLELWRARRLRRRWGEATE